MLEKALIKRAARGNRDAFEVLWNRYEYIVAGVAFKITKNHTDKEDVIQETAILLWRKLYQYQHKANFKSWLYRVSFNAALLYLRRKRPIREDCIGGNMELARFADDLTLNDSTDPFHRAFLREIDSRICTTLRLLPGGNARDFIDHHVDIVPNDSIADRLGISRAEVKSRMHRTRSALRFDLVHKFGNDVLEEIVPCCVNM
jgi:RNA polymerase sigma-70 factor, ECF subfamily